MSETYPPARKSNRARFVSHLYDYTTNIAELRGYESNRGIAAGTAAAMLGIGLDKIEKRSGESSANLEYLEAEAEIIDKVALSADEMHSDQAHFMDRFMDILVRTTMPESQEAGDLQQRMHDPTRTKKPSLSIRVFVSNLKELSWKMGAFFKLQYGIVHIFTWQKPTKTLSFLVGYTCVCMWPHIVLSFPLLFLLFGVILPGYLHRHPMDTPELMPVKKRGQSLLEFLNDSNETSLLTDIIEERQEFPEEYALSHSADSTTTDTTNVPLSGEAPTKLNKDAIDIPDKLNKKDKKKFVKSQVSLLINMRDLQNLTGDILKAITQGENLVNELTGFKDERLTTFIFYIVIVITSFVLFFGRFIPWRIIFIQSGWALLILCHPNTKKYIVDIQKHQAEVNRKVASAKVSKKEQAPGLFENFDRQDIIVDEPPEIKTVEIFELHTKDVFSQEWKFHAYSKRLFDFNDSVRMAGKLPHGVDHINKVLPPAEWKFDFGYANNWRIDTEPQTFLSARGLGQDHLKVPVADMDGWICDKLPVDQDTTLEFRRRRLYRTCYRYARPPKVYTLE